MRSLPGLTAPLVRQLLQLPVPRYGTVYRHKFRLTVHDMDLVLTVTLAAHCARNKRRESKSITLALTHARTNRTKTVCLRPHYVGRRNKKISKIFYSNKNPPILFYRGTKILWHNNAVPGRYKQQTSPALYTLSLYGYRPIVTS